MRVEHDDGVGLVAEGRGERAALSNLRSPDSRAEPDPFRVEVYVDDGRVRVVPLGELDLLAAGPFDDQLRELEQAGFACLVVDLRELSFMDCSGLRVLVAAHRRADKAGGGLAVLCLPGQVRRLLSLSGVDRERELVEHPEALTARMQASRRVAA